MADIPVLYRIMTLHEAAAATGGLGAAETVAAPQLSNADVPQKHSGGSHHTKATRVEVKQPTKVEGKQPAKAKGPTSAHRYTQCAEDLAPVPWHPCCGTRMGNVLWRVPFFFLTAV